VEIRYLGFDQRENSRVYRFDVRTDDRLTKQASVTADMTIFRSHSVAIQEGPSLCGLKLTADLERGFEGDHELTADDLRAHTDNLALLIAQRAGARKPPRRREPTEAQQPGSAWRNFGI
jgi:hypothetical protein